MLDANIKGQLQAYLERVTQPIEIVANLDGSDKSREMQEMLEDITGLSGKISLELRQDANERAPSFSLNRPGEKIGLRFAGKILFRPPLPGEAFRWATNSPRWCWPCCRSAVIRPRSRPTSSSK